MTPRRILVTPRSLTGPGATGLERLVDHGYELVLPPAGELPDEATLLRLVPGCVGWLAGVEPITETVLSAADQLRVISRNGSGVDSIDLDAARRRGITVRRAEGANTRGVAELTLALMLAAVRAIPLADRALKSGRWERELGIELAGRRLAVVGAGAIGREVCMLAAAMGMSPAASDPAPVPSFHPAEGFAYLPLRELLERSDVVTLHCPPTPDGAPVIGAVELGAMRMGAILINTARAALVDEAAVLDALRSGQLGAYATDVHRSEPPAQSELLAHERVIATPHIGGYTRESVERATRLAVDNLLEQLDAPGAGR